MKPGSLFLACLTLVFGSCQLIRGVPKNTFSSGYYKVIHPGKTSAEVYALVEDDVRLYSTTILNKTSIVDSVSREAVILPVIGSDKKLPPVSLLQTSFDIDFVTIPFKYRFPVAGLPRQFNANLNGAVFLGYRTDQYRIFYDQSPLGKSSREITHLGFSFGLFTGLGGTFMNSFVTNNQIPGEYDGMVWSKGIASIFAVNNFTVGVALGYDNLLDPNRKYWLYHQKPWLGFAFGLNIN